MKIVYNKILPPKGFKAITIFPFIFVRKGTTLRQKDIMHEGIHGQQEKEMLIIFFYLWYVVEWLVRLVQYRNAHTAYRNISLDREAYDNQYNADYLDTRRHYAWIKYLRKKGA